MIFTRHLGGALWAIRSTSYSPALYATARSTPGVRWEPAGRYWVGTQDAVATVEARLIAEHKLRITPTVFPEESISALPSATVDLRDYQKTGVNFLVTRAREGALLADEMGLGKSAQALRAGRALKQDAVVVCPNFVRGVWEAEAKKWWPKARVTPLSGTKPTPLPPPGNGPTLYIIHYDIVHAWADTLVAAGVAGNLKTAIFDEGHLLQSEKARRSQACKAVARACANRIMLTGTPIQNRPKDLWNPIDTISEGRFGKPFDFYMRYCSAKKVQVTPEKAVWQYDGASNIEELASRLKHFMLRRTKVDVALQLPPMQRQIIEVEVPRVGISGEIFASDRALRRALDLAADGKVTQAVDLICEHVEAGHKIVVFCHRRVIAEQVAHAVQHKGIRDVEIAHGGHAQEARQASFKREPQVLAVTLDATAVGIDLSYADVALFVELDWVPSKLLQGESRLHRFGQQRFVLVQYLIARGSVDELIRRGVLDKLRVFESAFGEADDKLREDLAIEQAATGARALKRLYERLLTEQQKGAIQ
jgi:SWI/SNF-related matrix-associated actin-dependent regulator 1 of chromatin subfamily A